MSTAVTLSNRTLAFRRKILMILAAVSLITGLIWRWGSSAGPVIAILDTGVADLRSGQVLTPVNVIRSGESATDTDGHGTKLAHVVLDRCPKCQVLPIKISERGAAIRPQDYAAGLREAAKAGARIVLVASGILEGSTELSEQLKALSERGGLLVAAAGVGVPNPFKPMAVSKLVPQNDPNAIVVGAFRSPTMVEIIQNYGPEVDIVAVPPKSNGGGFLSGDADSAGSSFGAAWVAGLLGEAERRIGKPIPRGRALTWLALGSKLSLAGGFAPATEVRHGSGVLEPGYPGDQLPVLADAALSVDTDPPKDQAVIRIQVSRALPEGEPEVKLICAGGERTDFVSKLGAGSASSRGRWTVLLTKKDPKSLGFSGCAVKIQPRADRSAPGSKGEWEWSTSL